VLLGCLAALVAGGCAGYRLGPTNGLAAGEKSIRVNPFSNQTMEPRLGDAVTTSLRRNLQLDGTYRLSTRGRADIVVSGVLTRYVRHELSLVPNDVLTVSDYRVSVTAQVTARDAVTGRVVLDRPVTAYTLVRVGSDLPSAERQAMPLLADDLAKNVTALLVDGTW
jgi:Lipopolysaccharide-assembly